MKRKLSPDEAALWKRVVASVTPLAGRASGAPPLQPEAPPAEANDKGSQAMAAAAPRPQRPAKAPRAHPQPNAAASETGNHLDGSWDRRLSRGLVSPESSIDLHGHSLASAYDRLDHGLDLAIRRGDRVLLLITGKPPRPESERPHARGAIRAAVGDWLGSSRHADRIAAVRNAHPRHGGSGALYIILRRPRPAPTRIS
jgi:DNA-nicking Smr family endonuclease